jgi:hypothetical protein
VRKRLLSVAIGELTTVRLTCRRNHCRGVCELPVARLADPVAFKCPLCQQDLRRSAHSNIASDPLSVLGTALTALSGMEQNLGVEFLIPDDPA